MDPIIEKALLTSIWALANQDSYREINDRFDMAKGVFIEIFHYIINLICDHIIGIIAWPQGDDLNQIISNFNDLGFLGTVGAIRWDIYSNR